MKYRIKTVEENGKYIGYVLNNDEVIFTSAPQETPTLASIQVTKYINHQTNRPLGSTPVVSSESAPAPVPVQLQSSPSVPAPPPRRCCGRG